MSSQISLSKEKIMELFERMNGELEREKIIGEIYLVGGAVMCLALEARESTRDVDAYFVPKEKVRQIARRIADEEDLPEDWLNDGVKGFFGEHPQFDLFLEKDHLKIFVAHPAYLLAMKCLSLRLGAEFQDEADVRYLLRYLNIETAEQALEIIGRYFPLERLPQKTLYALEELLGLNS